MDLFQYLRFRWRYRGVAKWVRKLLMEEALRGWKGDAYMRWWEGPPLRDREKQRVLLDRYINGRPLAVSNHDLPPGWARMPDE